MFKRIAALGLSALLMTGCKPANPVHVVIGIDVSAGTGALAEYARFTERVAGALDEGDDLTCVTFASQHCEIYCGKPPDSEPFSTLLISELGKKASRPGTYPVGMLKDAIVQLQSKGEANCCLLLTDADDDDSPRDESEAIAVGTQLSAVPNLREVSFVGIHAVNRALWKGRLGHLGSRLHFYGPTEHCIGELLDRIASYRN